MFRALHVLQEKSSDAPATSTSITGADLRVYGIRTLDEAINFLGMGMISERNQLGFSQYGSRGVNVPQDWMAHVLLVLDGHVVNNANIGASYADKMFGIPIEAIDHIEVILGPGSVLYGTNAMYGTINVVTRKASDLDGFRAYAETSLSPNQSRSGSLDSPTLSRFGHQYRLGLGYGKEFTLLNAPAALTVFADLLDDKLASFKIGPQYNYDNPNDPRRPINVGPNPPAGRRDVWSGYQENMHFFVPGFYSRFTWGNLESAIRYTRFSHDQNETAPPWGQLNQKDGGGWEGFFHADVAYRIEINDRLSLRPRLYGSHYDYTDTNRYYTPWVCGTVDTPCYQAAPTNNSRYGGELNASLDWFGNGRMNTMVGADVRLLSVFGQTETWAASGGPKDVSGRFKQTADPALAIYAQHIAAITDYLRVNVGLRADRFTNADHLSPRAAVIVSPWKGGTVKALYSEGFRRPAGYESGFAAPGFQVKAADLKPEVMRTIEGAFEQRVGRHVAKLSLFRTWFMDLITLGTDAQSGLSQYQNANTIHSVGGSIAFETGFGGWRFGANTTVSSSKTPSKEAEVSAAAWQLYGKNQPVYGAPNVSGNAQTSYAFGGDYPTLALAGYYLGPRVSPATLNDPYLGPLSASGEIGKTPTLVQLRATITGNISFAKGLSYRFATDLTTPTYNFYTAGPLRAYRTAQGNLRPEYQQMSRLTFIAGLDYRF